MSGDGTEGMWEEEEATYSDVGILLYDQAEQPVARNKQWDMVASWDDMKGCLKEGLVGRGGS